MQDRPTGPELLDALAGYLFGELRPKVAREERFQVLVAANLCAVLAREIRAGWEPSRADAALFGEILESGGPPDAPGGPPLRPEEAEAEAREAARELARRLRAGDLDDRLEIALERLGEHVRRKLDIARPGYAD